MDVDKIKILLEKYFKAEISNEEENELRDFFSSSEVPPSLEQYQSIFINLDKKTEPLLDEEIQIKTKIRGRLWLPLMSILIVLMGIGTFAYLNDDNPEQNLNLGTYDDPEVAFRETQKALSKLSTHLNTGFESLYYIEEYENSKNLIFKQ